MAVIKPPIPTAAIPNPMHKYASWTYAASLWWISDADQNAQAAFTDVDQALQYTYPTSYVIAEDSGLYPDRRLPQSLGLNYQIQDIDFETNVGPSKAFGSTNGMSGHIKIVEPYGWTLLETIIQSSQDITGDYGNYTQNVYLLQIDFVGYDDQGNPLPPSETTLLRKRFPLIITDFNISLTKGGAEYVIGFNAFAHEGANDDTFRTTPAVFTISAGTVKEFFTSLTAQYQKYYTDQAKTNKTQYAHNILFDFDPAIESANIVDVVNTTFSQADPNSKGYDRSKVVFTIQAGTDLETIITNILSSSDYVKQQLGLANTGNNTGGDQTTVNSLFKTTMSTQFLGTDASGIPQLNVTDAISAEKTKTIVFKVHQYVTFKGTHPALSQLSDSRPYTVKQYNFLYTGQNVDITDLKIELNATYYTNSLAYASDYAAGQVTQNALNENKAITAGTFPITPWSLAVGLPILRKIPVLTPQKYKAKVNDNNQNASMQLQNSPSNIQSKDAVESTYEDAANMVSVDMDIVGDPTLLIQDEILYSPSPNPSVSPLYNSATSQYDWALKYSQIKFNQGELVVSLTINTPVDIDTEYTNSGLMFPNPSTKKSIFSGQYYIQTISNNFSKGVFSQTLHMIRYLNHDYIDVASQATANERVNNYTAIYGISVNSNGVATNLNNSQSLIPTNATAGGDGGTSTSTTGR